MERGRDESRFSEPHEWPPDWNLGEPQPGPRERATVPAFPPSSPGALESPGQVLLHPGSLPWAHAISHVTHVSHVGQPKDQRAELLLLPLVPRCPAYPQQPFASSWQWPGRPQPQIQTSKGGAVFPHPALGLLSAGTAHGGPAEVGPPFAGVTVTTSLLAPLPTSPRQQSTLIPPGRTCSQTCTRPLGQTQVFQVNRFERKQLFGV